MLLLTHYVAPGELCVNIEVVGIVAFICAVVIGVYVRILTKRKRRRVDFFLGMGFSKPSLEKSRRLVEQLKIKSRGSVSLPFGAAVYVAPYLGGELIVCDLVVSVGLGRYAGFSKITVLGFSGNLGDESSFLMRKRHIMETRLELGNAQPLESGWYVWNTGLNREYLDGLAQRIDAFGGEAILRKKGPLISLYFKNKYLKRKEVEDKLSKWRGLCKSFVVSRA